MVSLICPCKGRKIIKSSFLTINIFILFRLCSLFLNSSHSNNRGGTVGANETERSINHNCICHGCTNALQYFSLGNYVSPDGTYKISLS